MAVAAAFVAVAATALALLLLLLLPLAGRRVDALKLAGLSVAYAVLGWSGVAVLRRRRWLPFVVVELAMAAAFGAAAADGLPALPMAAVALALAAAGAWAWLTGRRGGPRSIGPGRSPETPGL